MSHWLAMDDSSSDFQYSADWFPSSGSSKVPSPFRSTYRANTSSTLSFSFEGTSFAVYGAGQVASSTNWPKSTQLECSVDGASVSVDVLITAPGISGAGQWYGQENLSNGSHVVSVSARPIDEDGQTLFFDYAAVLPPPGLSLIDKAIIFDSKDTALRYGDGWNFSVTNQTGASLFFDFVGVGVSMYGGASSTPNSSKNIPGSGSYSMDGAQPQTFTWTTSSISQKLFQTSQLTPGNHTVEVVYLSKVNPLPTFMLRYFVVDTEAIASHKKSSVPFPVLIIVPILGGIIVIVAFWFLRRHLRKRQLKSASSYSLDGDDEQLRIEPLMNLPANCQMPNARKSRFDAYGSQRSGGIAPDIPTDVDWFYTKSSGYTKSTWKFGG
ncbi:hypothetical protein CPB83DRAFT_908492 [Crepidotus variabilis]|uniref:Transmembrane protein n=1 Tax=Crepidotus variabilis TaxID=179855 RepID=A0A9P6EC62_9AGAR|nr:hypothetical protein CPB83DRAFT_908492 [Crepidotus variabilis]